MVSLAFVLTVAGSTIAWSQDLPLTQTLTMNDVHPLDPARDVTSPVLQRSLHIPLPEEYIWTASNVPQNEHLVYTFPGITEQTEPHFFRTHVSLANIPPQATLYLAGPRSVEVWLNGKSLAHISSDTGSPLGMHVFTIPLDGKLQRGDNTLAIRAVRGRGVTGFANSALVRQQTFGQVLVAKIIPRAPGVMAADLLHSDAHWRSSAVGTEGWQQPGFKMPSSEFFCIGVCIPFRHSETSGTRGTYISPETRPMITRWPRMDR